MIMLLAIGIASAVTGEPSVNFSASDVSGPYPFSVTFTGQAINMSQPFSYHWDFGDGTGAEKVSVSTISPITHTYLHPGKYTVKLAVYDIGFPITTWVSTTKTDYIFVTHVPPTASFTASTDAGVGPVNISFTSTSTGYIEEYTWFIDGVSVSTGDAPITVFTHYFDQVDVPTLYSVILQTKGDGPTLVNSTPKTITIDPQPPVADFSATSTTIGQKPLSVQFKDDSTGYGISTWDWSFGDESFSSQQNPSHIYTRPGTYGVRLIVSSPYGTDGEVKNGFVHVLNSSTDVCPPVPSERTDIGIYKDGLWYLDANGNSIWDAGIDKAYTFGQPGWTPVKGDWNGDGVQDIGIYKDGMWYLDSNGNGRWDDGVDKLYYFGSYGWAPIVGDWTGSGITRIGVYKAGTWYLDLNNNGAWDGSPTDRLSIGFGTIGWESVPGKWG
jgi:PKD repeat protein